jgi:hypothetical protein
VTRKRKVIYPPSRSAKAAPAPNRMPINPPSLAVINLDAAMGRSDIFVGLRVSVPASAANPAETGVVERLVPGVIPAAMVRTESGKTRRVRTIDLAPVANPARAAAKE